ncbi:hypothetical protein SAGO17_0091 [Mimivirus AB-566-O17]|uniref:Uncharacterized protein n=1 Tax=Mimivirus AB-566-O17 TaxID=1988039 RepID=A0A1X9VNW7_9VIRU|nr:hypothetical protein SAGO17_0091 [Mimivirus AB-566-O17]
MKVVLLVCIILIIHYLKPSLTYRGNGEFREWGIGMDSLGYKKTLLDMRWIIMMVCILLVKIDK